MRKKQILYVRTKSLYVSMLILNCSLFRVHTHAKYGSYTMQMHALDIASQLKAARQITISAHLHNKIMITRSRGYRQGVPEVSGSDWSIASFLVPCQLTRFIEAGLFLSCSFLGIWELYQ